MEKLIRTIGLMLSLVCFYKRLSYYGTKAVFYLTFQSALVIFLAMISGFFWNSKLRVRLISTGWILEGVVALLYWGYLYPIEGFSIDLFYEIFFHGGLIPFVYNEIRLV